MWPKLAVVVLSIGVCACGLLALRQARLQAAFELTQAQLRIRDADERLWRLRAEIGRKVAPEEVERLAGGLVPLHPKLPGDAVPGVQRASGGRPSPIAQQEEPR